MIADIWASFRRLPTGVQAWVALWLGPLNIATLAFLGEKNGWLIAALAIAGMLPNVAIMVVERGMSARMAIPHLLIWTPLIVVIVLTLLADIPRSYTVFLVLLLVTDVISLVFDARDFKQWLAGERAIA